MAAGGIRVEGLTELNRAFARVPKTLEREWRSAQRSIAEPVRVGAEQLATDRIAGMPRSPKWARMRTGVTKKIVYVAPRQRGIRRGDHPAKRPNLAPLMMERAMEPALNRSEAEIMRRAERVLATVGRDWER